MKIFKSCKGKILDIGMFLLITLLIIWGTLMFFDMYFIEPIATDKANQYCHARGFDFYESFKRIGILSEDPVAITCKYVEQYRQIDINRPLVEVN